MDKMKEELPPKRPVLVIKVNKKIFYGHFENNSSAEALIDKLSLGHIFLNLHDYGGFEKIGDLPWELPRNDEPIRTKPGDIILNQGRMLSFYYNENMWHFTKIGTFHFSDAEALYEAFGGDGNVRVKLSLEWPE